MLVFIILGLNILGLIGIRFNKKLFAFYNWAFIFALLLFDFFFLFTNYFLKNSISGREYYLLTADISILLFMPCCYMYTRSVVRSEGFKTYDVLHILPAVVYMICYLALLQTNPAARGENSGITFGWYLTVLVNPRFACAALRYFIVVFYFALQLRLVLIRIRQLYPQVIKQTAPDVKWAFLYGVSQLLFFYSTLYHFYSQDEWRWLYIPVMASSIITMVSFIVRNVHDYFDYSAHDPDTVVPENVLSAKAIFRDVSTHHIIAHSDDEHLSIHGIILKDHQLVQIEDKIHKALDENQSFLKHRYTIRMLSEETGVQSHLLSFFINKQYKMNFNDFINEHRIKFCINKIKNDEWKYKTLEALSKESGFNNRNSFTHSFKKITGLTPSDFLKQLAA